MYSNPYNGSLFWGQCPQVWAQTFVSSLDLNYFSLSWNKIVLKIFRNIDKLLVHISLKLWKWWSYTGMLEFLWICLLPKQHNPEKHAQQADPAVWPQSLCLAESHLCLEMAITVRKLFTSEKLHPESRLLAFPLVTFELSTPGVHILVKGWGTSCNWLYDC